MTLLLLTVAVANAAVVVGIAAAAAAPLSAVVNVNAILLDSIAGIARFRRCYAVQWFAIILDNAGMLQSYACNYNVGAIYVALPSAIAAAISRHAMLRCYAVAAVARRAPPSAASGAAAGIRCCCYLVVVVVVVAMPLQLVASNAINILCYQLCYQRSQLSQSHPPLGGPFLVQHLVKQHWYSSLAANNS